MISVATALIAVAVSLLVTRVAALALTATGMRREAARFQARSAFTGVGFTTSESERVLRHPVRRRIIMALMLLGNAGIITIAGTVIISFTCAEQTGEGWLRLAILLGGLFVLLVASNSSRLDRRLTALIGNVLERWTDIAVRDYGRLMQVAGEYGVSELEVQPEDWVAGRTLGELELRDEGVVVLGIQRAEGLYLPTPKGATPVRPGDTLILYGRTPELAELDQRPQGPEGDRRHADAVARQRRHLEEQDRPDDRPAGRGGRRGQDRLNSGASLAYRRAAPPHCPG